MMALLPPALILCTKSGTSPKTTADKITSPNPFALWLIQHTSTNPTATILLHFFRTVHLPPDALHRKNMPHTIGFPFCQTHDTIHSEDFFMDEGMTV